MEIGDNLETAIGYSCVALVFISYFLMVFFITMPQWTTEVDLTADDDLLEIVNITDNMQQRQYENELGTANEHCIGFYNESTLEEIICSTNLSKIKEVWDEPCPEGLSAETILLLPSKGGWIVYAFK